MLQERKWYKGQNIDALDTVNMWVNAEILFVGNSSIYVHYSGWSVKYDESIPANSHRLLHQWQPNKPIQLHNRIDAYHTRAGWLEARVIELGNITDKGIIEKVQVHFVNYHPRYNTWVNITDNNQVATIGSRSKAYGIGKNKNPTKPSQLFSKLLFQRNKLLIQGLKTKNMLIRGINGDGNCLFRSISHQLYGSEEYHLQIRHLCMNYILYERRFFEDYVVGGFEQYVEGKKKDGVWGDDLEIQALSEIYSRPIQIYVFGQEPIRTFHEENQNGVQPIRLAYVGACHYDSIKPQEAIETGLMTSDFGHFENMFLSIYKSKMNNIQRNRNVFACCNRLEDTIGERLEAEERNQTKIADELKKVLEMSETEAIIDEIEHAEIREVQVRTEEEKIQEELQKIEEKELEEAKKISQPLKQEKPYWFDYLITQGFSQNQIWFAIECKGLDPDAVQNFLFDNTYL